MAEKRPTLERLKKDLSDDIAKGVVSGIIEKELNRRLRLLEKLNRGYK